MRSAMLATLALAAVLAVAGCGDDSSSNSGGAYGGGGGNETGSKAYGYGGNGAQGGANAAIISVGSAEEAGSVLVDSNGMTLYYFEKDVKGSGKSACYGACANAWPPLTTSGAPSAEGSTRESDLGTIERSDGTSQATYAGWPLYTYIADEEPGDAKGTDIKAFGGTWYPLHANGEKAGE